MIVSGLIGESGQPALLHVTEERHWETEWLFLQKRVEENAREISLKPKLAMQTNVQVNYHEHDINILKVQLFFYI
jgi:hypothetical protein